MKKILLIFLFHLAFCLILHFFLLVVAPEFIVLFYSLFFFFFSEGKLNTRKFKFYKMVWQWATSLSTEVLILMRPPVHACCEHCSARGAFALGSILFVSFMYKHECLCPSKLWLDISSYFNSVIAPSCGSCNSGRFFFQTWSFCITIVDHFSKV